MNPEQEAKFEDILRGKAARAKSELRYPATKFLSLLEKQGAFATARKLIARSPTEGFTELLLKKRLDLSIEAVVIEPEWRGFFDEKLVSKAERLLSESGYEIAETGIEYLGQFDKQGRTRRKNTISFSAFCEQLGAPLVNVLDRWCAISETRRMAVFTVWVDKLQSDRYVFFKSPTSINKRIGAIEMRKTIATVIEEGYAAYGILCEAKDPSASPRTRGYFQDNVLLALSFVKEGPETVAYVIGEVASTDVKQGLRPVLKPFSSATEDLDIPPGIDSPGRVTSIISGYRRDKGVRDYVLGRAQGECEYCSKPGFELRSGSRYLETHHVIALSADGPDTINNVIALCPSHHREAHYGKNSAELEQAFLTLIPTLNQKKPQLHTRQLRL